MPAQQLPRPCEMVTKSLLTSNASSAALVKRDEKAGPLEFVPSNPLPTSGRISMSQWLTVITLVFVNLINYMDRLTLAGILDDIKKEFNANNAMGGLLQTAFIISYMLFAPLFGYLGDRHSRKAIMAAGVFLWSVFTLIGSFMSGSPENRDKTWTNMDFWAFLGCRAMVGIGEASYSTIAPTIISDMFVKDVRSKMLALFYFAIPVGSGLGYIVGSETAKLFGHWQWGLRATPVLGLIAVFLIIFCMSDPPRGESEGLQDSQAASYTEDLGNLGRNKSFVLSTLAFTCVTFCTGALSWWGPIYIADALRTMSPETRDMEVESVPLIFGAVTMMSGIIGVPLGMILSTKLKAKYPRADPVICAVGILISALFLGLGMVMCTVNIIAAFILLFVGEVALNLNWSIVADMLLYIVVPTCRSTAEAVQILFSHAFGDAGSPYLIGLVSDGLYDYLSDGAVICPSTDGDESNMQILNVTSVETESCTEEVNFKYTSLQYSFFFNCGIEVVGGILFLITAIYIVKDKLACENNFSGMSCERVKMTKYSPQDSLEELEDEEMIPKLKLICDSSEGSSSRSPSPEVV